MHFRIVDGQLQFPVAIVRPKRAGDKRAPIPLDEEIACYNEEELQEATCLCTREQIEYEVEPATPPIVPKCYGTFSSRSEAEAFLVRGAIPEAWRVARLEDRTNMLEQKVDALLAYLDKRR